MLKVLVIQRIFTYYRTALFSKLCLQQSLYPQYTIAFGEESIPGRIASFKCETELPSHLQIKSVFLKNIYLFKKILWQKSLLSHIIRCKYNAVIFEACPFYLSTWIGAILAKLLNIKVFFWGHGFKREEKGIKLWLRCRFYSMADALLVYGKRGKALLIKAGFKESNIFIINNSIDIELQNKIMASISVDTINKYKRDLFVNHHLPTLLWVGRLTKKRRLDMLIISGNTLIEKGLPVNILLVGDGEDYSNLYNLVLKLNLERYVRFFGACYEEETLGKLFSLSQILVSPGPVGLSCIHALAYGIPVITNNDFNHQGPETDAIIPGINGDFFKTGDQNDLSSLIERWLAKVSNSDTYKKSCLEQIKNYSPQFQSEMINFVIEKYLIH